MADPVFLEQTMLNLVINARDAMASGGRITIETWNEPVVEARDAGLFVIQPGEYVCLRVRDTGHGIPPEIQQRIFEPFFTTKSEGRGTGLGLATVYGIVKQLGGYIVVDSAVGQGAAFQIFLPRSKAQQQTTSSSSAQVFDLPQGLGTILVVEDEEALRAMVQEVLTENGYHVLTASHGAEALEVLEQASKVDLVLTDVVMPEMNGVALARHLAKKAPGVPILFISGYTDDQLAYRGILLPDVHLLAKPFSPQKLLQTVGRVLHRKSRLSSHEANDQGRPHEGAA
nr:ATP-binding protein [Desulfosoma caldarium]